MITDLAVWQVEGERAAIEAATKLIERSAWFQVEPRPCNWFAFAVKAGDGHEIVFNTIKTTGYRVKPDDTQGADPKMKTIKVRDLRQGDKVDLENVGFDYSDPLAEFEYAVVDEIRGETDECFLITFENMTAIGLPPGLELQVQC